eukprot:TRINITY_DN5404_c0_g1_i5.p2 TRINITY_DN5404_c0_g1~~TRINITY_DN5404_c0_g1_i5.p2  ORF type:complete len:274 (+),score=66.24 TRINITY_DN5404_c0_g1_i5:55-876(+)
MQTMEALVALGSIVDQAADEGEQWTARRRAKGKPVPLTYYDAEEVVDLDTADYLKRWSRHLRLPKAVFVVASVYLDRFVEKRKVSITHYNKFRALLCCLVTADKFLNDKCATNRHYAVVGGVELEELNHLERMFLADIRFGLYVSNSLYEQYCEAFEEQLAEEDEELPVLNTSLPSFSDSQQSRSPRVNEAVREKYTLPAMRTNSKVSLFSSPASSHAVSHESFSPDRQVHGSFPRTVSRVRLAHANLGSMRSAAGTSLENSTTFRSARGSFP